MSTALMASEFARLGSSERFMIMIERYSVGDQTSEGPFLLGPGISKDAVDSSRGLKFSPQQLDRMAEICTQGAKLFEARYPGRRYGWGYNNLLVAVLERFSSKPTEPLKGC